MDIQKLKQMIETSKSTVFLGGAGVSTESGIPDFRSAAGLYSKDNDLGYAPEYLLSHSFFANETEKFFDYYRNNLIYKDAKPNKAHIALAELEKRGKLDAVVTQNIDGLHELAGSKNVIEIHGSVFRNYCVSCGKKYDVKKVIDAKGIPTCDACGGVVRPDVVLYEEGLNMSLLDNAINYIQNAETLIVGGTSLNVYPVAGLLEYFRGKNLVIINKTITSYDNRADLVFRDSIGDVLSSIL
ncbi:MAG: NAD-dependent protein deacylase [Tissierellia bacterium]|nr:NAD-dependent protein deacylase [Tissierellia bacterium]